MVQLIDFGNIKPINFETAGEFLPPSQREREEELVCFGRQAHEVDREKR